MQLLNNKLAADLNSRVNIVLQLALLKTLTDGNQTTYSEIYSVNDGNHGNQL